MTGPDSEVSESPPAPDPLIGIPERNSAQEALEAHLIEKRLDPGEYGRRVEAAQLARTQSELLRIFSDLPVPHPTLPPGAEPPVEAEDEPPPAIFFAGCLTLALGLPVAVVLGFVYGGFVFTINQANAKATTSVPAGWTANATCWVTKKGGTC